MSAGDRVFAGGIPELYDAYLVPLIFEPYAQDLARRVASLAPGSVLELATGTGVVPRALAPVLPAGCRYVATDLNQPMLDHASERQPSGLAVEWRQADAGDLPFADATFDVVVCQFGVMFFGDRAGAFAEARRVLRPGGALVFNTWDDLESNEFAHEVTRAVAQEFPNDPPRFLARTPHGYCEPESVRADLRAAGFGKIAIDTVSHRSRAPSPMHPAMAYCQGTPLRGEIEARDAEALGRVTAAASRAIAARFGDGPVDGLIRAHVVTSRV